MREEIQAAVGLFLRDGAVVEIRMPGTKKATVAGYYTDAAKAAADAARWSGKAPGVYVTINPVNPDLLARSNNRLKMYARNTAGDADILARSWLPIDFDAKRPAGISATDAEHELALRRARDVRDWLRDWGWPDPVYADSGNGGHLLYALDLPNDEASTALVQNTLKAIGQKFDDESVVVDKTTYNLARIWKLYGTKVCKGDETEDRPHRLARIIDRPDEIAAVSQEQIEQMAQRFKPDTPPPSRSGERRQSRRRPGEEFNLRRWMNEHGVSIEREQRKDIHGSAATMFIVECPWNSAHKAAHLTLWDSGRIGFRCFHDSCEGNGWRQFREFYEPGCYDRQSRPRSGSRSGGPYGPPPGHPAAITPPSVPPPPDYSGRLTTIRDEIETKADRTPRIRTELFPLLVGQPPTIVEQALREFSKDTGLALAVWRKDWKGYAEQPGDTADAPPPLHVVQPGEPEEERMWNGLALPAGWDVEDDVLYEVVYKTDSSGRRVAIDKGAVAGHAPRITRRFCDVNTEEVHLEIAWNYPPKGERRQIVPRNVIASARDIVNLSAYGGSFNSGNARKLIGWFAALEGANEGRLPVEDSTNRCGWHHDAFLWGRDRIGGREEDRIILNTLDTGDQQSADALSSGGDREEWYREMLPAMAKYPLVSLVVIAAATAPLVGTLRCGNFVVELASTQSSIGKTSALRLAQSVWGRPRHPGFERRFLDTTVAIERFLAFMSDLPTFFDDTQVGATFRNDPATLIYMATDGYGRGRGTLTGREKSTTWDTVLMTTGERPLEESGQYEGLTARIISTNEGPFGDPLTDGGAAADEIAELMNLTFDNYGWAGQDLIRYLVERDLDWRKAVAERFVYWLDYAKERWSGHPTMARRANYVAALLTTAELATYAWDWPVWSGEGESATIIDPIQQALDSIAGTASVRDAAKEARDTLLDWCAGNLPFFFVPKAAEIASDSFDSYGDPERGVRECYGVNYGDGRIAVFVKKAREVIEGAGYSWLGSVKEWRRRGWLDVGSKKTPKGKYKKNTRKPAFAKMVRARDIVARAIVLKGVPDEFDDGPEQVEDGNE